jgi:hyperosmotically inducible periplasmic protein
LYGHSGSREDLREDKESDMTMAINRVSILSFAVAVVFSLLTVPQLSAAVKNEAGIHALAQDSSAATAAASARLDKKQFRAVKVNVENGIATLTGAVDLYQYKADAEKKVRRATGVMAVRNLIEVAGPSIPDRELQQTLQEKLTYDRVGYGNAFNAISLNVESGIVTLGGHARTDVDKDSALALVSIQPGVKDVIEEIEVDPVSIMDDRTRMAVARAIYGYPSLNRYSIDPAKPIRISVQNGHVELYGVVDSRADKDLAFIQANGVPGIFSVKNYLQIAGQPEETPR